MLNPNLHPCCSAQVAHALPDGRVRHHRGCVHRCVRLDIQQWDFIATSFIDVCRFSPSVAGLIDSLIYHSARVIQKKIELGKAS